MKYSLSIFALVAAMPVLAEETRHLDAHEHGVGTLDVAIQAPTIAMVFKAPGADIVGFEYEATSQEDIDAVMKALASLRAPLDLFEMPAAAGCVVSSTMAELESEEDHDDHDDHKEGEHDDHDDHDEHKEGEHDDHADHEEHADEAGHTEFHAEYELTCDDVAAVDKISFGYFEKFANAQEVEVQIITIAGAKAYEVERDDPVLNLER